MKKRIPILGLMILFLAGAGYAQESLVYEIDFETPSTTIKDVYLSEVIKIKHSQEKLPFIGTSAYCKDKSLTANLFYRTQTDQKWSEWIAFRKFTEGQLTDRVAYEGPPILQKTKAIQFRSDQKVAQKIVFRLYFPAPAKKKMNGEIKSWKHSSQIQNVAHPLNLPPAGDNFSSKPNQNITTSENHSIIISQHQNITCVCEQPAFCGRNCWCPSGNCPPDPTPVSTTPTHIIIHHSAGFNSSTNFPAVVAYYWDLHVNTNGWDDIGYNWLIDAEGTIYEGRGNGRLGAHFSCMNGATIGICMIGNFQNIAPTEAAINSLKAWLAWESCNKEITLPERSVHAPSQSNLRHVSGHRDANSSTSSSSCASGTVCPGEFLYTQLDAIAEDVAGFSCLNPVPDLVIRDMWTEPTMPVAGDTVDLYVSFKNVGADTARNIRWDYRIGEETIIRDSLSILAPGEAQTRFLNNYVFSTSGSYNYCIYADAVAGESNSANNSFCRSISVSGITALQETDIVDRFVVYPNPGSGFFHLEAVYKTAPGDYILQLMNSLGQIVYTQKGSTLTRQIDIELKVQHLPPGSYFLRMLAGQGRVVRRLVLE